MTDSRDARIPRREYATVAAIIGALALTVVAPAVASTPSLDKVPTRPTITRSVSMGHPVKLPARVCAGSFSDFQAYSGRTSRAYVGQSIEADGIVWSTRSGQVVASLAWDDCTVRAFTDRALTFGAWREDTRN